jgi:hypothetical protein
MPIIFSDEDLMYIDKEHDSEAPNRSRAAGHLMTTVFSWVALTMPCPSRSRAAGYND